MKIKIFNEKGETVGFMRIKMFEENHKEVLERKVNEYLKTLNNDEIVDLKYQITLTNDEDIESYYCYTCMVVVRLRNENKGE